MAIAAARVDARITTISNHGTMNAAPVDPPGLSGVALVLRCADLGAALALTRRETSTKAPSLAGPVLTPREREVRRMMTSDQSNQEIAGVLFVSVGTGKVHVGHILAKLGLESRATAVAYAHRQGLA
jgi:DNA-binding NarL/FixJ family response regulator